MQVTEEHLKSGGCLLQCFAAFIREREGRFARALSLCERFGRLCKQQGFHRVERFSQIEAGSINALLTVEEGGAIEGSLEKLEELYSRGVRMMTLTWNYENELGAPNRKACGGVSSREKEKGLTEFGKSAVERMKELKMIVDVSHGSDKLVKDVADIMGAAPFVASHSGAAEIFPCSRNLEDEQIKLIAESGGVIGLYFCADFLSPDPSFQGQKEALLAHAEHIVKVGGEDVLALGSDFDGIPENAYLKSPSDMPKLLSEFEKKFGGRAAEKFARQNALRVLKEVL